MLTPAERSMRTRVGAFSLHAQGGTSTKPGTAAFLEKFERQVDPDGILEPAERARRATFALKAHMGRLALKASRARQSKIEPAASELPAGSANGGQGDGSRSS